MQQKDMQMDRGIMSLYICVKDMNRAIRFYEEFLEQSVTERDQTYSVFDVGGFRFGLFAYETMNETHVYGNNCVPSFHFDSLEKLRAKICNKEICFELTRIKQNWVVEIVDSEGNHIEVTAPI